MCLCTTSNGHLLVHRGDSSWDNSIVTAIYDANVGDYGCKICHLQLYGGLYLVYGIKQKYT